MNDEDAIYYRWCESSGYDPDSPVTWRIWTQVAPREFDTWVEKALHERDGLL